MKTLELANIPVVHTEARSEHCLRLAFANGRGISVIDDGYGHEDGLYEVMEVGTNGYVKGEPDGWLTEEQVREYAARIASLSS